MAGPGVLPALVAAAASAGVDAVPPPATLAAPAARTVSLSPEEMFAWAERAERAGDLRRTVVVYEALVADRNSAVRAEARFRLARLRAAAGDRTAAALLLRQILDEQPAAAPVRLALAQLLVGIGDEPAARRELRALQAGSLPPDVARLVDRFSHALRVRKPLGASVEIALAPDSNINRATRSDTVGTVIGPFTISDDGKATSGLGVAVRGQAYGRLGIGDDAALLGRAAVSADLYRQADYRDLALDLAVGPEVRIGRHQVRAEVGVTRRWFGKAPLLNSTRIAASVTRPLGGRTQVRVDASAALVDHRLNDLQDGRAFGGSVSIERALSATSGIALTLAADRQALKDPAYSTTGWRGSALAWRDVGRATLTAAIDYGRLAADERLALFPDRRMDRYLRLSLGGTLRHLTYRGFAPVIRTSFERNDSSIAVHDFKRRRTEIGIARAF